MVTKRCEICDKVKNMEDKSICCPDCEDREMDLLIASYAFIHCYDADYCPVRELITTVPSVRGTKLNQNFIKNWLMKNWLEKNDMNSIRVPPPLYKELEENGFTLSDVVRNKLVKQKEKKMQLNNVMEAVPEREEPGPRVGMVYMEKKKD